LFFKRSTQCENLSPAHPNAYLKQFNSPFLVQTFTPSTQDAYQEPLLPDEVPADIVGTAPGL